VPATAFVNPAAGAGCARGKVAEMRDAFARQNYSVKVVETESADELRNSVRTSIGAGSEVLIAMGGDGTLQLLVGELLGHEVPEGDIRVGVIPAGGGNDFATALGISLKVKDAVAAIVRGQTRRVDVVQVRDATGRYSIYLGGGGLGLDAEAARYASGRFLKWPGRLRYIASAIVALQKFSGAQIEIEFPNSSLPGIKETVLLAAVLNTPSYGGGLRLAPGALLDDGMLEVALLGMLGAWEVAALLPRLLMTGELKTKKVARFRAPRVRLAATSGMWFHGDGELLGPSPVEIEVMPKKLRMLVP
jgi:diacylglycerol kinase (ATP)